MFPECRHRHGADLEHAHGRLGGDGGGSEVVVEHGHFADVFSRAD
jgi:hypothetical protein